MNARTSYDNRSLFRFNLAKLICLDSPGAAKVLPSWPLSPRGPLSTAFRQNGSCGNAVNPQPATINNTTRKPRTRPNNEPRNRSASPSPAVFVKADAAMAIRPIASSVPRNSAANANNIRSDSLVMKEGSIGPNRAANEFATMKATIQPANDTSSRPLHASGSTRLICRVWQGRNNRKLSYRRRSFQGHRFNAQSGLDPLS